MSVPSTAPLYGDGAFVPEFAIREALINGEAGGIDLVRMFTGYSGWAPGQLDAELTSGAWHVVGVMPDDVFTADPDQLWRSIMRRQGGRLAAQGLYPDDISVN